MRRTSYLLTLALLPVLALTAACGTDPKDVTAAVNAAVAHHTGAWTDDQLRAAAGQYADDVTATHPTADGGTLTVELGRSGGHTSHSRSRRGHYHYSSTTRSPYKVDCLTIRIVGAAVVSDTYSRTGSTRPDC